MVLFWLPPPKYQFLSLASSYVVCQDVPISPSVVPGLCRAAAQGRAGQVGSLSMFGV